MLDNLEAFSEEQKENNEDYLPENQRFLIRAEEERLAKEASGKFVKSILEVFMFNSANVFLSLYLLNIGLGIFVAAFAGFGVGCIPAIKNISENASFRTEGEERSMWIDGKMIRGIILIFTSAFLSFNAISDQRMLNDMAKNSQRMNAELVQQYERDGKKGIDPQLLYNILIFGGAMGGVIVFQLISKKFREF